MDWNAGKRCLGPDRSPPFLALASPEVDPSCGRRQPQVSFRGSFVDDWADQERRSEHELILDFTDSRLVWELQWKRAHDRIAPASNIPLEFPNESRVREIQDQFM